MHTLTLAASKGGVGKTTLTSALAVEAAKKLHVGLYDLDPQQSLARWHDAGYEVVGVSCDSFAVHKAWADQLGLEQTLLADMHRSVCKAYGFYWPELNIASRGTVVIETVEGGGQVSGRVKWVQAREPGNAMDVDEVLGQMA